MGSPPIVLFSLGVVHVDREMAHGAASTGVGTSAFGTLGLPLGTSDIGGEKRMAGMADRRIGGISMGGIIVILGIILLIFWSFWIGLIVVLIGLIAFGGFARGKWY
jgi:hypothetical protein